MAFTGRSRTPLIPAIAVAVMALLPPAWLGWAGEVGAVLWIPLQPAAHALTEMRLWLRPPDRDRTEGLGDGPRDEVDGLRAVVARLRLELEQAKAEIAALEGAARPEVAPAPPLAAAVVTVDRSRIFRINRGSRHGVAPGDVVVEGGGTLAGRVAEPVGAAWADVIPPERGGSVRARLFDASGTVGELLLIEPGSEGWQGEVDAGPPRTGSRVRLDDPSWPAAAQGLLLGSVEGENPVEQRPLRTRLAIASPLGVDRGGTVLVWRCGVPTATEPEAPR